MYFVLIHFITPSRPLYYVGMRVFKTFEVCDILEVEESMVASWLKLMETHYHRQNAYHNSTHAADVLQATAYFIKILQDYLVSQGVSEWWASLVLVDL